MNELFSHPVHNDPLPPAELNASAAVEFPVFSDRPSDGYNAQGARRP